MAIIFALCTLAALVVIANSKSLGHQEETCYDCTDAVEVGVVYKRQKRGDAPQVINAVNGLLQDILVARANREAMIKHQTIYNIGSGHRNTNTVMLNIPKNGYSAENTNSWRASFKSKLQDQIQKMAEGLLQLNDF